MRAQEFLNEIEKLRKSGYEGGKDAMRYDYGREKTVRPLPGGTGLLYSITSDYDSHEIKIWDPQVKEYTPDAPLKKESWMTKAEYKRYVERWQERSEQRKKEFARSPGHLVGKLAVDDIGRDFPIKGAVQVSTVTVDEDYRGRGIAKALYGIVLTVMKRVLIAGSSQTPGGRQNWVSLSQIPGVEMKGYIVIEDYELEGNPQYNNKRRVQQVEQTIDTIMGQLGGQYIGDSRDYHYFAFDVQPTTTGQELQAYVDTKLNRVYTNGYRSDGAGLFARWVG